MESHKTIRSTDCYPVYTAGKCMNKAQIVMLSALTLILIGLWWL